MAPPDPNAERFRLQLLLGRAQTLSNEHWFIFNGPLRAMGESAWVSNGGAADAFGSALQGNDRRLHTELRKALDLIADKVHRTSPLGM